MSAMLRDAVARAEIVGVASFVLIFVAVLFLAITVWAVRADSARVFERASRMPFADDETGKDEIQ